MYKSARRLLMMGMLLPLSACENTALLDDILAASSSQGGALSTQTIDRGLREALTVGSGRVVDTLGRDGGFLNSIFHIPLPDTLADARGIAGRFGLSGPFDQLEVKMNEAAEAAIPEARQLFVNAITRMTFSDVMQIYNGPDDAATQYLRRVTSNDLERRMRPVIDRHLQSVGAVRTFTDLAARYNALPLVTPIDADLNGHVSGYALNAIFNRLATEESAIRNDPVKRTTALLRQVFG